MYRAGKKSSHIKYQSSSAFFMDIIDSELNAAGIQCNAVRMYIEIEMLGSLLRLRSIKSRDRSYGDKVFIINLILCISLRPLRFLCPLRPKILHFGDFESTQALIAKVFRTQRH